VWISPTRLAAALAGSGGTPEATHGCVIVETNYRVHARPGVSGRVSEGSDDAWHLGSIQTLLCGLLADGPF